MHQIHPELQGREPRGPGKELRLHAYKKITKYAKSSRNKNRLWVSMTNAGVYSVEKKRLNRSSPLAAHWRAVSVPIATWIPQVFFPPLIMFSPGILYFNIFLENDLNGPGVIFGNYLLTFTLRVSSIRQNRGKGATEKSCVRLGSSSIIMSVCHLFSWFTAQRKMMCLSSPYRLAVSMMDSWSCMVKR